MSSSHEIPLRQYLAESVPALASQLDTAGIVFGVQDMQPGLEIILNDLFLTMANIVAVDGHVSDTELQLFIDTVTMLDPSYLPELGVRPTVSRTREFLARYRRAYGAKYVEAIPHSIQMFDAYDKAMGTLTGTEVRALFFRFANALIKADGKITKEEESTLRSLRMALYPTSSERSVSEKNTETKIDHFSHTGEKPRELEEVLRDLDSLVGLDSVKQDVLQLVNFMRIQQMRLEKGMPSLPVSRHLVFFGNPGTGKTTVARLLAQIYHSLGLLEKGHLIETDRSGLVAGYIGQTAIKVQEVVNDALGGILFIDEAYSLAREGGQDYGLEAIETLLKLMEDNRDNLIVIVAGYPDQMKQFIRSNPGLKSRFNKYFSFPDYAPLELLKIFHLFCRRADYRLSGDGARKLMAIFNAHYTTRDEVFGNARLARNIFEQAISNQANRVISMVDITDEALSTLGAADIPGETSVTFG